MSPSAFSLTPAAVQRLRELGARNRSSSPSPWRMRMLLASLSGFGSFSRLEQNSIDIRLMGPLEFVDRLQNSIDPISNEFDLQATEKTTGYTGQSGHLMAKSSIFVVFRCYGWARMTP